MELNSPEPFFDNSWLAVPCQDVEPFIETLGLSNTRVATWGQGLSAVCGDFWESGEKPWRSRVFITPRVGPWRLAVGGWIASEGGDDIERIVSYCERLSRRFTKGYAFTTQGRMGFYSWVFAENGVARRVFDTDGERTTRRGQPPEVEQSLLADERYGPTETTVMGLARHFSVCPLDLGKATATEGDGYLAVSPWGRSQGVPTRTLWRV